MEKVFNFDIDRCVACHACIAACFLENGMEMPVRKVWGDKAEIYPGLPVHNISMACNHCLDAPCINGCPAKAYYRDEVTGAVRLRSERCIGCSYCYWNCPYDAPQYNNSLKVVEKCNLCHERLLEGADPACASGCPTGALSFIESSDEDRPEDLISTITEPRLIIEKSMPGGQVPLEVIPRPREQYKPDIKSERKTGPGSEWSLILFTYISSLLFAFNISNWFGNVIISIPAYLVLVIASMLIPLIHLGKPLRAWRSVSGIFTSPLSNEIAALMVFALSSSLAYLFNISQLWLLSFAAGFLLLISIDSVYVYSDRRFSFKLHPGQTFLSGLFTASCLLQESLPFIIVGALKVFLSFYYYFKEEKNSGFMLFSSLQLIVFIYLMLTVLDITDFTLYTIILLLLSELAGRIYYYYHFKAESYLANYYAEKLNDYEKEIH